ncbi:MAG: hypothetical protein ABI183_25210 [Polyangiaceae bacterium]
MPNPFESSVDASSGWSRDVDKHAAAAAPSVGGATNLTHSRPKNHWLAN